MRVFILIIFTALSAGLSADSPYGSYLSTRASSKIFVTKSFLGLSVKKSRIIPRYEIPKGSVFCRMEERLKNSTGLWLKIGVK